MTNSRLAVILVHFGDPKSTLHTLRSLSPRLPAHTTIYVLNNTSSDLSVLTKEYPSLQLHNNPTNIGFGRAVNQGIKMAVASGSTQFLVCNNDLNFVRGTIPQLQKILNEKSGLVAPLLHHSRGYDWGGKLNPYTGLVKHDNYPNPPKTMLTPFHAAAACWLVSIETIKQSGYFDERFFMYYEDLDYSLRLSRAGLKVVISPDVVVEHKSAGDTYLHTHFFRLWLSHFRFVTKHLGRVIYPTSYLYSLIYYPLIYLKSFFTRIR